MKKAIPLNGHVVLDCTVSQEEKKTDGGFIMHTSKNKSAEGIVIEVAEDVTSLKVGDKVLMRSHASTIHELKMEENGVIRDIVVIGAEDIICKLIEI